MGTNGGSNYLISFREMAIKIANKWLPNGLCSIHLTNHNSDAQTHTYIDTHREAHAQRIQYTNKPNYLVAMRFLSEIPKFQQTNYDDMRCSMLRLSYAHQNQSTKVCYAMEHSSDRKHL